jgi:hypothetical protein
MRTPTDSLGGISLSTNTNDPTTFEQVINLKIAKAPGPQSRNRSFSGQMK